LLPILCGSAGPQQTGAHEPAAWSLQLPASRIVWSARLPPVLGKLPRMAASTAVPKPCKHTMGSSTPRVNNYLLPTVHHKKLAAPTLGMYRLVSTRLCSCCQQDVGLRVLVKKRLLVTRFRVWTLGPRGSHEPLHQTCPGPPTCSSSLKQGKSVLYMLSSLLALS
jgi:hypothetical protein